MKLLIILFLSFGIIKPQENIYKSKEYGFSVVFPDKVELDKLGSYGQAFTSFELIGEQFIMYQVQVLNEQPGAPLYFNTIEQTAQRLAKEALTDWKDLQPLLLHV